MWVFVLVVGLGALWVFCFLFCEREREGVEFWEYYLYYRIGGEGLLGLVGW